MADVLGAASVIGPAKYSRAKLSKFDPMRPLALEQGFQALRGGEVSTEAFLDTFIRRSDAFDGEPPFQISRAFGWFRQTLLRMPSYPLADMARRAMSAVALRNDCCSRKSRPNVDDLNGAALTLNELAQSMRMNPAKLRFVARHLRLINSKPDRSKRHFFRAADIALIREFVSSLVARRDAICWVKLTEAAFDKACFRSRVSPFFKLRGTGRASDFYLPEDLRRLRRP